MTKLDWPYPRIVAHRGGGKLAPENTLAAIDCGHQYGHHMIEVDAKLSADLQVFLLHDDTLQRTTNQQGVAGDFDWASLRQSDAGSWFAGKFSGEPLPLLSEVAERCRQYQMFANIEIKPTTGLETVTGEIVAQAARQLWSGMPAPILSSFSAEALFAAMQAAPELPRGLLLDEWQDDWRLQTDNLQCVAIHLNYRLLTPERIAQLKAAGLRILAYTVNHPNIAHDLLEQGVDMICTDSIDIIGADFQ